MVLFSLLVHLVLEEINSEMCVKSIQFVNDTIETLFLNKLVQCKLRILLHIIITTPLNDYLETFKI